MIDDDQPADRRGSDPFDALLREVARAPIVRLADLDLTGRTIGRYTVRRRIGRGGMGVVYEAWDTRLLRAVALKVLHVWRGDVHADRLVAEARRAAAVTHPNIAAVFDVDTLDGVTFMALEFVEGRSLDRVLASGGVDPVTALRWARRIASALAHAHLAGIVHRDITPSNVMIGTGGALKLLDFGIATARMESAGRATGTPGYQAPEQAAGGPVGNVGDKSASRLVDARADVYSFGVLLREMLASRPMLRDTAALRRALERVGDRCASPDPADRPSDGAAVVALLRALPRGRDRRAGLALGAAAAATVMAALFASGAGEESARSSRVEPSTIASVVAPADRAANTRAGPPPSPGRASGAPLDTGSAGDDFDPEAPGASGVGEADPGALSGDQGEWSSMDDPAGGTARLPVTAAIDSQGRLVAVADLRGLDPIFDRAIGQLRLDGSLPGRRPARPPGTVQPLEGTLVVATTPEGSLRVLIDLHPAPAASSLDSSVIASADPSAAPDAGSPPATLVFDASAAPIRGSAPSGVGPGNAAVPPETDDDDAGVREIAASAGSFHAALCGVPAEEALTLRVDEMGHLHVEVGAAGELPRSIAVLDGGAIVQSHEGAGPCPDDEGSPNGLAGRRRPARLLDVAREDL